MDSAPNSSWQKEFMQHVHAHPIKRSRNYRSNILKNQVLADLVDFLAANNLMIYYINCMFPLHFAVEPGLYKQLFGSINSKFNILYE